MNYLRLCFFLVFLFSIALLRAQLNCGTNVPTFNVNLTGQPNGSWTSPNVQRVGNCCGDNTCVGFIVTLDPNSAGVSFSIISGSVPGGALSYQINCGGANAVGGPVCLTGVGPHYLTFCKPGNNLNEYQIVSIEKANVDSLVVTNANCSAAISVSGVTSGSVTWNSIFPGTSGQFNSNLTCTSNCNTLTFQPPLNPPPFIDYVVCGTPSSTCSGFSFCDTVRVQVNPVLNASLQQDTVYYCSGTGGATLNVVPTGGSAPYIYSWSTGATGSSLFAPAGTYSVWVKDQTECDSLLLTGVIIEENQPQAGSIPSLSVCTSNIPVALTGTSTTQQGFWAGGSGSWNGTGLIDSYTPSATELSQSFADVFFVATGTICPNDTSFTRINLLLFDAQTSFGITQVSCFGNADGQVTFQLLPGSSPPYTYAWQGPYSGDTLSNLIAGNYTLVVTDAIGCTDTLTATVTEPAPLSVNGTVQVVSCPGNNDGAITLQVSGGTTPYSYAWNNGSSLSQLSGISGGIYSVLITDFNGCAIADTFVVTEAQFSLNIQDSVVAVACTGDSTGTVFLFVSGGISPYTFLWSTGANSQNLTSVPVGTYSVVVQDANGCLDSLLALVTEPDSALFATSQATNVLCFGDSTGAIQVTTSGGTGPYQFLWSNGAQTESISGVAAGAYSLQVTDFNGCTFSVNDTVTEPLAPLSLVSQVTDVACHGDSSGAIQLTVSGGTSPYQYLWNTGAATAQINTLPSGSYSVLVTDANGCTDSLTATVNQPAQPLSVSLGVITDVDCFGFNTGSISVQVQGGTPGYQTVWSNGASGLLADSLIAGLYSVLVTDTNGCVDSLQAIVTEPVSALLAISQSTNVLCFGDSTGAIQVTTSGGTGPYQFLWSNGAQTESISGVAAGAYSLQITDFNGCTFSVNDTVTEPLAPLSLVSQVTDVACHGDSSGATQLIVSGGTSPYQYLWNTGAATAQINTLPSGSYSVLVTDANGCTDSLTATVNQPAQPLSVSLGVITDVDCFGFNTGSISVQVQGGTPGYQTVWSNGASGLLADSLIAGLYSVLVTDTNGCVDSLQATVTEPPILSLNLSAQDVSCFNGQDGEVQVTISGGTAPYLINWSNGASTAINSGLAAGLYSVTVIDTMQCSITDSIVVNQPPPNLMTPTADIVLCSEAFLPAIPFSATFPGSTFNWTNSNTLIGLASSGQGNISSYQTPLHNGPQSLVAQIIVTPSIGLCVGIPDTFSITVLPLPDISAVPLPQVLCSGDTFSLSLSSTVPGTVFSWSVSGAGGANAGTGSQIQQQLTNLTWNPDTAYYHIGSSAAGCTGDSLNISVPILPIPIVQSTVLPDTICSGNSFTASFSSPVSGTTFTRTFLLQPNGATGGSNGIAAFFSDTLFNSGNTPVSAVYHVLPAASGCSGLLDSISVLVLPIPDVQAGPASAAICSGTQTQIVFSGQVAGTIFSWNTAVHPVVTGNSPGVGDSLLQTLVNPGLVTEQVVYTVTPVAQGCAGSSIQVPVDIYPLPPVQALPDSQVICSGQAMQIQFQTAIPGTSVFTFPIPNAAVSGASADTGLFVSQLLQTVNQGPQWQGYTYFGSLNGCNGPADTAWVFVHPLPVTALGPPLSTCLNSGLLNLPPPSPPGGLWFGTGVAGSQFDPLIAGVGFTNAYYQYTDPATGCVALDSLGIQVYGLPIPGMIHDTLMCVNVNYTFTNTSIGAGQYTWNFGNGSVSNQVNPTHSYGTDGFYTISLVASTPDGCTDTLFSSIQVIGLPSPQFTITNPADCNPHPTTFVNQSQGAFTTYFWNFGNGSTLQGFQPGMVSYPGSVWADTTYIVSLTGVNLCGSVSYIDSLVTSNPPTAQFAVNPATGCTPLFVNFQQLSYGSPLTYFWDFGNGNTSTQIIPGTETYINNTPNLLTYPIVLTVTNLCGSSSFMQSVSVIPDQVNASITATPLSGCAPLTVNFSALFDPAVIYNWDFGDGNFSNAQAPVHTYQLGGNYLARLAVHNQCGTDTGFVSIIAHAQPQLSFMVTQDSLCAGQPMQFLNTSPGLANIVWHFGDGNSSNLQNPQHIYTAGGLYPITLVGTGITYDCVDSIQGLIFVKPSPTVGFTLSDSIGCQPFQVQFSQNSGDAIFLAWDYGDGQFGTGPQPTHTFLTPGYYIVNVIGGNQWGCTDTAQANVWVNPKPTAQFGLPPGPYCESPLLLTPTNTSTDAIDFTWWVNQTQVSNQQVPELNLPSSGIYNVSLIAGNQFLCFDTLNMIVDLDPGVSAAYTVIPDSVGCAPFKLDLLNLSTGADTFQWIFSNGETSGEESPVLFFQNPGTYGVTLIASNSKGCSDTIVNPNAILVHPSPVAGFLVFPWESNFLERERELIDLSSGANAWNYHMGNGDIFEFVQGAYIYPGQDSGVYQIMQVVFNVFGCTDTAYQSIRFIPQTTFYVPNAFTPNQDGKNEIFRAYGLFVKDFTMAIFNRWGQLIFETDDIETGWDGSLNNNGLPGKSDVYVYRIRYRDLENNPYNVRGHITLVGNGIE